MAQARVYSRIALFFLILIMFGCKSTEINQKDIIKSIEISKAVDARQYIFKPTSATPTNFRTIDLQPGYYLKISGDSVKVNLPYYGRSYTAPIDPTKIGINFTSTKYEYSIKEKKSGWDVTIKPKDENRNFELYLSIGKTGYSSLRVFDTYRQNISYYGNIENTDN